jgi:hypothetical protein
LAHAATEVPVNFEPFCNVHLIRGMLDRVHDDGNLVWDYLRGMAFELWRVFVESVLEHQIGSWTRAGSLDFQRGGATAGLPGFDSDSAPCLKNSKWASGVEL